MQFIVPDFMFFGGSITNKTERSLTFLAECRAKGLRKLGVEKCTLVGLSYGGMVGFKMIEMYSDLVESMVVTGLVMALTESITCGRLKKLGLSSWQEHLLPVTVVVVKEKLDTAASKLLPNFVYRHILEESFALLSQCEAMFYCGKNFLFLTPVFFFIFKFYFFKKIKN